MSLLIVFPMPSIIVIAFIVRLIIGMGSISTFSDLLPLIVGFICTIVSVIL